jgi:uncharacterized membrane protein (UPF0127 family)
MPVGRLSPAAPRRGAIFVLLLALLLPLLSPAVAQDITFTRSPLAIHTTSGDLKFEVELALTPEQRSRGLMFRDKVAPYTGMLFDFGPPQPITMWMMNTKVSLDMLFIAADGTITRIAANTEPYSTKTIDSGGLAKGVLEIAGGHARLLGIKPGDRILHPIFGTATQ